MFPDFTFWAPGHSPSNATRGAFQAYAAKAGFDGSYTYDPVQYTPGQLEAACTQASTRAPRCPPSVSPGFGGRRGGPERPARPRIGGWGDEDYGTGASPRGADVSSITWYNEWQEGTQMGAGKAGVCLPRGHPPYCYSSYEG